MGQKCAQSTELEVVMNSESEAARTSSSKSNGFIYSSPRMIEVGTVESLTHGAELILPEDYSYYDNSCSDATPDEDPQSPSR
jgi:hypothetical protein